MITEGIRLLSAVARDGSAAALSRVNPVWLTEPNEEALFGFISTHFNRFGVVPNLQTLHQLGHEVTNATEPLEFYLSQVSARHGYNILSDLYLALGEAIASRNVDTGKNVVRDALALLSRESANQDVIGIQQLALEVVADIRSARNRIGNGITTGYAPIDDDLVALNAGDMVLLVARPKQGKSYTLLYMLICNWLAGKSVLAVTMEMSPKAFVARILSIVAEINPNAMRGRRVGEQVVDRLTGVITGFADLPPFNFVAGNFRKSPGDVRKYVQMYSPDVWAVDGSYLLTPDDRSRSAKHEVLADVIQSLKATAEDTRSVTFQTVQFNRQASNGSGGRRRQGQATSDLDIDNIGGSDAFGQTPSCVLGMSKISGRDDARRLKMLVAREAPADADIITNFTFDPPNFSYLSNYTEAEANAGALDSLDQQTIEELL